MEAVAPCAPSELLEELARSINKEVLIHFFCTA